MGERLRRVLVGGGSGFVGGQLVYRLRQCGFTPVILGREFDSEKRLKRPEGSLITYAELEKAGRLPAKTEAVVCLSGANIGLPFRTFNDEYKNIVRRSRIGPTDFLRRLILATPKEERPKVFVQSSAIGIYPPSQTAEYDEDYLVPSPSNRDDYFTSLVRDWEASGRLSPQDGTRHVILRIGLVMGRTGGIVEQSYLPFSLGLGGPMGSGGQWFPWVHVDDVCGLIIHSVEKDDVSGTLNAVSPGICSNAEFASAFGAALGRPACIPMPEFVVKTMFGGERAAIFLSGQKVIPKRALGTGFRFMYPDIKSAATEFARAKTDEEKARLTSAGQPISSFQHQLFQQFGGMKTYD